jgi:hypothetical protein
VVNAMKIKMYKVKQKFNSFYLENVESTVKQEIDKLNLKIKKGIGLQSLPEAGALTEFHLYSGQLLKKLKNWEESRF